MGQKTIYTRIPKTWKTAKQIARAHDTSISRVIEEAIIAYVANHHVCPICKKP